MTREEKKSLQDVMTTIEHITGEARGYYEKWEKKPVFIGNSETVRMGIGKRQYAIEVLEIVKQQLLNSFPKILETE